MARLKKISFWGLGLIGGFIVLLLVFILLLPHLVNLDPFKERILTTVSDRLKGQVQYQGFDLSFFPRPRVEILGGRISIPETMTVTLKTLTVYPKILPLFRGKVQFAKLVVESPDVRLEAVPRPEKIEKGKKAKPFSPATLEEEVGSILAFIRKEFPGLTVIVKRGRLEVDGRNRSLIRFEEINARVNFPPGNLTVEFGCRSNLWESLGLSLELNPETLEGNGRLTLTNLNLVPLAETLLPEGMPQITESQVDLDLQFEAEGLKKVSGEVEGSIPNFVLQVGQEKIALKGETLKGAFSVEGEKITFSLSELNLKNPQMKIAGKFQMDPATPYTAVEAEARDVNVSSTRKVMLSLVGKDPTFQTIFDFVRGGEIPQISLKLWGKSIGDLGQTEKIFVKVTVVDGNVVIPKTVAKFLPESMDLKDVKGEILISKGMLEGKNIEATWENETVRDVRLRMGLEGKDAPFHLEGEVQLDLSQLSPMARRLLKDEAVLQEISRIEVMKGGARGRLVLGESLESVTAKAEIQEMKVVARYGPVLYELNIDGGQVFHEEKKIGVNDLKGGIGRSSFSGLTGHVEVRERAYLEVRGGKASVDLDEIFAWLSSYEAIRSNLKDVRSLNGSVSLSILDLKGPLSNPKEWGFHVTGEIERLAAEISPMPGSTVIESAQFQGDQDRISFKDADVRAFDTGFHVSGSVAGYLKKLIQLELLTQVDLAKLPPILKHFIKDESFQKELALVDGLSGTAGAKLILEVSPEKRRGRVEGFDLSLSAKYRRIPYDLKITDGRFSYGDNKIGLVGMGGGVGGSLFSQLSLELDLEREPYLEVRSGKCTLVLDEIYRWLLSDDARQNLRKGYKDLKGAVTLSEMKLKGPLSRPGDWYFEVGGEVRDVQASIDMVQGPIVFPRGKFKADQHDLSLADFHTNLLDASFEFSGTLHAYLKGLEKVDLQVDGEITPKDIQWLSDLLKVKGGEYFKAPLYISDAHLSWEKSGRASFDGNITVKDGPRLAVDVSQNRDHLRINKLFIQDDVSRATISMAFLERVLDVAFSGSLSERTLDKIFSGHRFQDGWMRGDIRAHLEMDQPMKSSAEGRLEVDHLSFPWQFGKAFEIDRLSLTAMGKRVKVDSADLRYGDQGFSITGDVSVPKEKVLLDLDVSTESLDINEIMKSLGHIKGKDQKTETRKAEDEKTEDEKTEDLSHLPVQGKVRFKTGSLTYDRFAWTPFRAEISLVPDRVRVDLKEADLCGISTLGSLTLSPKEVSLDFRMVSKNQDLRSTLTCMAHEQVRMDGKLDLNGRLKGQGKEEELASLLQGNLDLAALDGRIYKAALLAKIFGVLNVTQILRGKLPEFGKEGLPYDSIGVKANLENRKIRIEEATLQGPTVEIASYGELDPINREIDLTVLVAPFRTVDYIINKIPLVRTALGGTLITVPAKVKGNLDDPEVIPLSPSAVGSEVVGIMKRTLELPFKVVSPFLPKEEKEKPPENGGQ